MMKTNPRTPKKGIRVLFIDIETAPATARIWGLRTRYVPISQVVDRGRTLCFAARWEGQKRGVFASEWTMPHAEMIRLAYALLNAADVVIHYNGKKFDIPVLNREFAALGLPPPENYKQIDLFQVVRSNFRYLSNSMNSVAQELGLNLKMEHKGMGLWEDVLAGKREARSDMRKYNEQDIVVLEDMYYRLRPWIRNHPNRALFMENVEEPTCPSCGSTHVQKRGVERPAGLNAYQRYKCMDCGANSRGRVIVSKGGEGVLL